MNVFARILFISLVLFQAYGSFSQTINLTSSPQYVRIGDLDVAGNQITVEALVKFTGGVNIVSKHTGPANVNYLMRIGTFEITTSAQFYLMSNPYAGSMQPNTWYHVAGTYDGSYIRYYVNGCLIVQQPATGNIVQNNLITGVGNMSSSPNGEQFYGEIDELRIWSVARTPAELSANMFDLPNPTSYATLKGYYKFDGNVLNIQGNAAYNGVWVGTPAYGAQPQPNVIPSFSVQSVTPTNVSCFGYTDGAIAVAATGNNLQYSINNTTWQSSSSFTGLAPGNYTVYTRTPEGCVVTQNNISIAQPAQVNATASNTGPYCPGDAIQLNESTTSTGTVSYAWTGPGGYTSSAQNPADATAAGTYNLTVTSNGCASPASSTTVTIKPTPNATAANTGPYCQGAAIQLNGATTATGTNTYAWTGPGGYTSSAQNPANATAAGTYTLTVTSNGCASAPASTSVTINPLPTATAGNTGPYCSGAAIQLNGSTSSTGTVSYAWTGPGGYASSAQNPANATAAGTYTLTVTENGCQSAASSTTVVINAVPVAIASNAGPFCNGAPIQLNGSTTSTGTASYAWTGPGGYTSAMQNPTNATAAGTYSLMVTVNGCQSAASSTVVNISSTPPATAANTGPYCAGAAIQLNGSTTASGTNTYAWTGPGGFTSSVQNPTNATAAGTYTLIVTSNGCPSAAATTNVTIKPVPMATAGNSGPYCGAAIQLTGSTSTAGTPAYSWTGPGGYTSSVQNPGNATAAGAYSLVVTIDGCAGAAATTQVVVNPVPVAAASNGGPYCAGEAIQLSGSSSVGGTNTYTWAGPNGFTSAAQNVANATEAGTYTLVVTNNGCTGTPATTVVSVYPNPDVTAGNTGPYYPGQPTQLNATTTVTGAVTYAWSGPGGYVSTQPDPSNAVTEGIYTVVLTDANGCTATSSTMISFSNNGFLIVPNVFTPNGDGKNDVFLIQQAGIKDLRCSIFNRWGELVYEITTKDGTWDGKSGDREVSDGVYFYVLEASDYLGKKFSEKGNVHIAR